MWRAALGGVHHLGVQSDRAVGGGLRDRSGMHPVVWNKIVSPKTPVSHGPQNAVGLPGLGWAGASSGRSVQ